jgi:hypothetical protein
MRILENFYPWDMEPTGSINSPSQGADTLYTVFRNPMAHALGYQDPEPPGPISVTRFPGGGMSEDDLERIEAAVQRPTTILRNAPTLRTVASTQAVELNVESFYWGVRELVRRLTGDGVRMAAADAYLRPMLRP